MSSISSRKKKIAGLAIVAIAALPLAACGSSGSDSASSDSKVSVAKPVARLNDLSTGGTTAIKLDQGFVDALTSLKLTPGVVDGAKLEDGSLIFPITGGNVTYFKPGTAKPYVIGQIQHEASGLSLTAGDTKVELTNFNVDPGISRVYGDVTVNGKVAATSAFLFQLRGATLKPLQAEGNTAILEGTKVFISPVAAGLLNKVFKTDAVTKDLLVGVAKITVNTK
ncbi:hypothetical protein [Aeromicrobium sp. Root236]|uniref:hypothetical protein n=1 Tax=Aeromicrobium sp. Root236 TaxID=1736498 RepID=UPI000B243DF4|nr:hypothetical protein [Aeromicrobium sp. Root236]